jgi:hypothetical protein
MSLYLNASGLNIYTVCLIHINDCLNVNTKRLCLNKLGLNLNHLGLFKMV